MKRFYILLGVLFSLLTSMSCSFLEEYSQDKSYVHSYTDLDELLLGDGYMPICISNYHIGISYDLLEAPWYYPYIHLMGDEVSENIRQDASSAAIADARELYFGYYTWQPEVGINVTGNALGEENKDWNNIYRHINVVNMILAAIDDQTAENADDELEIRRVRGEARFLRAAWYFTLVNLYAQPYVPDQAETTPGVPLKTTEYIEDKLYTRNSVAEVYRQILDDLGGAEEDLSQTPRKSVFRADITAVELLTSRVYLYMQQWEKCCEYASKVIARKPELQDLNTMAAGQIFLTGDLNELIFTMGSGGLRSSISNLKLDFGISPDLFAAYDDPDDLRLEYFVKYNATDQAPEYVKEGGVTKLNRRTPSSNFAFRTAEAYLNLAEAAACNGEQEVAVEALDELRRHRIRSSAFHPTTLSGEDLITFIRNERRRELCLEGHRWFDLRRYTVSTALPYTKSITHSYTTYKYVYDPSSWSYTYLPMQTVEYRLEENDAAYTLPIPHEVLEYDTEISNNPRPQRPVVNTITY